MARSSSHSSVSALMRLGVVAAAVGAEPLIPLHVATVALAAPPHPAIAADSPNLPLSFVPNAGQTDPAVRFQAHSSRGAIFFAANEVVIRLPSTQSDLKPRNLGLDTPDQPLQNPVASGAAAADIVRLRFVGANAAPEVMGRERLPGRVNFFIGDDPARWHRNLPTYGGIVYRELYPGIDLHYEGTGVQLKGTYFVAAGGDPSRIRWHYDGAQAARIDQATGTLRITLRASGRLNTPRGSNRGREVLELAPVSWQDIKGHRVPVDTRYVLEPDGTIGFALPNGYDGGQPLNLDPALVYSTYLGGSVEDNINAVALDGAGNIYVTGLTFSTDYPTQNPEQETNAGGFDAFVTKLNASGSTKVYSTYLGGTGSNDYGQSIAVDAAGNAYVSGLTDSTDFPTAGTPFQSSNNGGYDAFVSKLNAAGSSLLYSTYLGGTDLDWSLGIAVHPTSGDAYITGRAASTDFPKAGTPFQTDFGGGVSDAFVAKIRTTQTGAASLPYSSCIGGDGEDRGSSISVDAANGIAFITGRTNSTDFPNAGHPFQSDFAGGTFDAFALEFDTTKTGTAALIYSTYLGGGADDRGFAITRDSSNHIYLSGRSISTNFPTTLGAFQTTLAAGTCNDSTGMPTLPCPDTFVAKINPAAASGPASLAYSTYLGGNDFEEAFGVTVDSATGNVFVTGYTNSPDFPTEAAFQPNCGANCGVDYTPPDQIGFVDAFVTKLNATGTDVLFSSFLGASSADLAFGIARNATTGDIVIAGETLSPDFPTRSPVQDHLAGSYDLFVVRITENPPPTVSITAPSDGAMVTGSSVTVSADATDDVGVLGVQFKLDDGNLGSEDTTAPYAITWDTTTSTAGSHTLTAVARDGAGNQTTSTAVNVTVTEPTVAGVGVARLGYVVLLLFGVATAGMRFRRSSHGTSFPRTRLS